MKIKKEIQEIEKKMRTLFSSTKLEYSDYLSKKYEAKIYLKREDLTPVRSYKIRGAFHLISKILEENKQKKKKRELIFVCASAGNHAQGFALVCQYFKISGTIFMPVTTPKQKIERTKDHGGKYVKIELVGDTFDVASKKAQKFTKEKKAVFIPPFNHPEIMKAAATISLEILNELEKIDAIVFPVGGGGLAAGNAQYLQEVSPKTEIFYAEPEHAPSLTTALQKGQNIKLKKIDTFVDGCAVAKIGGLTFKVLQKYLKNKVILCPENRVAKTILEALHYNGMVLEPAGALSIDALENIFATKKWQKKMCGKNIVCIVSGGNFDFSRLPDLEERKMKYIGLKKYLILQLPQRAGALKEFLNLLGPSDDITRFEYLKKSAKIFSSVLLGIETNNKNNFKKLFQKLEKNNFEFEDITENELLTNFLV